MKSRPFPIIALLALAAGGVAIYLLNHLPASSARSAHLTSDRAVPRPREKRSPDPFGELDPRLHGIVERLEKARKHWEAETPAARLSNSVLWRKAAMEALKDVNESDALAILGWSEMHPNASPAIGLWYVRPLHQRLAFLDPAECRAALMNERAGLRPDGGTLGGVRPWGNETEDYWYDYYRGLSQRDPKEALDAYWKDGADERLGNPYELRDLYAALAATDPQSVLQEAQSETKGPRFEAFIGFCRGAPNGQNWAQLADKMSAIFHDEATTEDFDRAAGKRWLMEDPRAALEWYAGRQKLTENQPETQHNNGSDSFGELKSDPLPKGPEGLIEDLAHDESIDPETGAGAVLTKLIASGDPQQEALATAALRDLVHPLEDPEWFQVLSTLPDDDARSGIFMDAVSKAYARNSGDPFAPELPDDGSPNPQAEALRPWIAKMRLSPENTAAAEEALKSVEEREAADRKGEKSAKPDENDPFAPPKQ